MTEVTSDALAAYAGFQPAIAPPQPTRGARILRLMLRQPLGTLGAIVLLIMLLAAIDAWSTRQYYARLRSEQLTAQIRLSRELIAARKSSDAGESSKQTV